MKLSILKWNVVGLSVVMLGACAQFGQQAPLQEPIQPALSQGVSNISAQDAWWLQLNDKKLNAFIAQAIQTSPDLRIAKARFEQAQALLGITQAADKTQIGITVRGAGMYVAPKPASSHLDTDNTLLLANAALQGSWSFDFWGKNREQVAAVLGQRQAVVYEANQAKIQLANAVAAQYFAWQNLVAQQSIISERLNVLSQRKALIQRRVNAKLMPSENLYPIEMAQQKLQLQRLTLGQQINQVRHSLAALMGQTPDSLSMQEPAKMAMVPRLPTANLRADFLANRPDIAAQKALLASKLHTVNATKAEFYPNIELKLLAGLSHLDAFNVIHGRTSGMLGIVPALNLPLFTSGALQSKLAGKNAEYNEQVAVYDQTVLNAMRAAADAINDYQSLHAQQVVLSSMQNTLVKSQRAAQKRVLAGLENGLSVLQTQDELLQLKSQYAQQQTALLTAWSNVHTQMGGGFKGE